MNAPLTLDALELTGRSRSHVQEFFLPNRSRFTAHEGAGRALLAMREAAQRAGIDIAVASAFRSFDDQARIWQRKWRGERPLLNAAGQVIPHADLSPAALVSAILEWSALPGASRHHWGSDFDVFDRAAMPMGYQLQLIPSEYAETGPFSMLTAWLDAHMADFGFFRPYDEERGGVHPEPWHLSWYPLAEAALATLTAPLLQACIAASSLEGKAAILERIDAIHASHVCRIGSPHA